MTAAAPHPTTSPPLEFPSYLRAVAYFEGQLGSRRAAEECVISLIDRAEIRIVPQGKKMPTGGAKG